MRKLLIAAAATVAMSGAAFAQGANQGAGSTGPQSFGTSGTANTNPTGNAPGAAAEGKTISSNGTGTTATGGITSGVGTTLSTTGVGGNLGNNGAGAGGGGGATK